MKRLTIFFKEKYHIPVLFVMVIAVFYVVAHVGYFVDDQTYYQAAVCEWPVIFQFLKWHLMNFNGRTLAHFLVILFLRGKWQFVLWKVLCTAAFCSVPVLCSAITSGNKKIPKISVLLIVFLMTATYPYMWDWSVYWLTGSFNYLFPSVFLLVTMLAAIKKPGSLWIVPLAFFCGATTEQAGLMTVGFFLLVAIDKAVIQKKSDKKSWLFFISSCAGFSMILICPGNYARFSNQEKMTLSRFAYNLFKLIRLRWIDNICIIPFTVLMVFFVIFWLVKFRNQNKFTKTFGTALSIILASLASANLLLKVLIISAKLLKKDVAISETFNKVLVLLWLIYAAVFIASALLAGVCICLYRKQSLPLISLILAMGSQFMLAASDVSLYRTCVPGLFTFYVFVSFSLNEFLKAEKVRNINIRLKSAAKICLIILCFAACAFQIVTGLHCIFPPETYNSKPLDHNEMTAFTDELLEKKTRFYSGDEWHEDTDIFDFSQIYF